MCNDHRRTSSVTEMLSNLQWDTLPSRRQKRQLKYMNRIVSGRVAVTAEDYLEPGIIRTRSVYSTKYKLIPAKTVILKNSYTSHALLWTGIRPQPVLLGKLTPWTVYSNQPKPERTTQS